MTIEIRTAGDHDLDAIVGLTAEHRNHLAEWAPAWWRKADGADELHPLFLGYLIGNEEAVVRVVEANGDVVGCAISMPQGAQWFIDDIAVDADGSGRNGNLPWVLGGLFSALLALGRLDEARALLPKIFAAGRRFATPALVPQLCGLAA
jgi:hypothetical protein